MRLFPRTARRGLAAAATAGALALGALTVPSTPFALLADGLKDRERKVERRIDSASSDLDESSDAFRAATVALRGATAKLSAAQSRLTEVRARLTVAQVRDREMAAALAEAVGQLADARQALEHGRRQVSGQRDAVADVVAGIYTQGDPDLLAFASLIGSETTADLTRRAEVRNVVVGLETRAYDELRAAEVLLVVEEEKVERARDAVAERRREAAEHLATMEALEVEAASAADEVRQLVDSRSRAQARADRARSRDLRSLRSLEREQDRIEEMLRRRAEAARRAAEARARAAARRGASRSSSRAPARDGYLDYPVRGYITSPYGMRTHPIYGYRSLHDGVDFGSGCGAPLYASAPGRVVQRYFSDVWGNRLVVANGYIDGKGLATIYNHAASYVVGPGAKVSRGQLVGYMGNSGWSTGCHLHFTVMANGEAVDPMNWF